MRYCWHFHSRIGCIVIIIVYRIDGDSMRTQLKLKNRLKEFRQEKELTQNELAQLVGTSRNTISSIETGQFCPTAYLAAVLCVALECEFEELFYLDRE